MVLSVFPPAGRGAALSQACGSTVHMAFHGSRHAEVAVRSADVDGCAILGSRMRSALQAAPPAAGNILNFNL